MYLSVFTPTYNRASTLSECYISLCAQTWRNFTWIIIDDGSTDETEKLVEMWQSEKKIQIVYHYQSNQGKHIAFNKAVSLAEGDLCLCLDSDEILVSNAFELVINYWSRNNQHIHAGMIALKGNMMKDILGTALPEKLNVTVYDLYNRLGVEGDKLMIFKTDIVKKIPFPKIKGEKFLTEAYLYDRIDRDSKWITFNKLLVLTDYYADGYTARGKKILFENPRGFAEYFGYRITISHSLKLRYLSTVRYLNCCLIAKDGDLFKRAPKKILTLIALPVAIVLYLYRNINKKN